MSNDFSNNKLLSDDILWNQLEGVSNLKVSENRYRFAAEEKNNEKVVQAALEALQKTDPNNANYENAILIAEKMRSFAIAVLAKLDDAKS